MTFDQLLAGTDVFLDANTFVYAVLNHPAYGGSCTSLLDRLECPEVQGFTRPQVLSDAGHRLMTFGSPGYATLGVRLERSASSSMNSLSSARKTRTSRGAQMPRRTWLPRTSTTVTVTLSPM